ncbi:hypothetical protein D3C74_405390 [compost metagenome]
MPRPRKDSAASASTAMAKETEHCTTTMPMMLGSTWRRAIRRPFWLAALAAMMYSVLMTCSVPLRATRANPGIEPMPMASMAVSVLAPKTAPNMMATSSAGKASRMSAPRIVTSSATPPRIPARIPSGVPISSAMPTATRPTSSVMRAP